MLCLNSHYRAHGRCAPLPVDGYAHHAYTTQAGPVLQAAGAQRRDDRRARPPDARAGPRGAARGRIPRHMPIWLTEFGIQSKPDPLLGVSARAPGRVPGDQRAHRLATTRASSRSRSTSCATTCRAAGAARCRATRVRVRPADRRRARRSPRWQASACRWRPSAAARASRCGASCARRRRRTSAVVEVSDRGRRWPPAGDASERARRRVGRRDDATARDGATASCGPAPTARPTARRASIALPLAANFVPAARGGA